MPLTDLAIRKLRPKKCRYEVADIRGLFLRVLPSGKKAWSFRYIIQEQPRRMFLGYYPALSLAQAHEKHALALQEVQRGIDPAAKAREDEAKRRAASTVKGLWLEFLEKELKGRPATPDRERMIEKDVLPVWEKRKVASITRRDAVLLLDDVRERAPVTANRLQGLMVRMFNFAAERGHLDHSPLAGMRSRTKEAARARVLSDDEIKTLWAALDLESTVDIYRLTKLALKAILLTGQRPGEVAGMRWDEIDDETWVIPKERSKNGDENRVPVLPMLKDVIEQARVYSSDSPFVFRSSHGENRSVTVGALANALRRHRTEMKILERFTPHDLRRTVRTRLAEIGVSDIVAEKVLGHKLQGILAVYNRHPYEAEKRAGLSLWEQRLKGILGHAGAVSNVIPFEVRRG
jgi:integrase